MSRKQEIECIIIGTLLCSTEDDNFFKSCKSCVTEGMFTDEVNRRIYKMVAEMNAQGMPDVNPLTIYEKYGEAVRDICYRMCELSSQYSFIHRKCQYNERQFLLYHGYGQVPHYTNVTFDDYVNRFIQDYYDNESK
jgi:hypothetical protein